MIKLFKKTKNNKGEVEPLFFVWGIMIVIFVLWFSLDLINITWSRYTIQRETQTMARLYALNWTDSVWDPNCTDKLQSNCMYNRVDASELATKFKRIVESAASNGKFSEITVMITNNPNAKIESCSVGSILCLKNNGNTTTVSGWNPNQVQHDIDYGTDLYITVKAIAPYRFVGKLLGLENPTYVVQSKFASERFAKNNSGVV